MKNDQNPWLFLGATGRVGQLLTRHWAQNPSPLPLVYQTRAQTPRNSPSLLWSPLDGAQALVTHTQKNGPLHGMIVFIGATPGQSTDMSLNQSLAEACLDAALRAGIQRVLLASSSAVYGVGRGVPLRESDALYPVNDYGTSKARMEDACGPWRARGLDVCCLRIGNVAGADALLKQMNDPTRRQIDQYSDGLGPQRSYIGPAALAHVLTSLATHTDPLPACLNIGTPDPVRMADLATAANIAWDYVPAPHGPQFQSITIDCRQLQALHSFTQDDIGSTAIVRQLLDLT